MRTVVLQFPIKFGGPGASNITEIANNYRHVMSWGSTSTRSNPVTGNLGNRIFLVGLDYHLYVVTDTNVRLPL
jgi:hypothetical protein